MSRWLQHVCFWIVYLCFEVYVEFAWISPLLTDMPVWERMLIAGKTEVLIMAIKVPLVYYSFTVIHRYSHEKKQYFKTIALLLSGLLVGTYLHRLAMMQVILPFVYEAPDAQKMFDFSKVVAAFLDLVFIACVANALRQYRLQLQLKTDKDQLVKEKLETELSLLKAQTNPHFLFNTLNNIYALARKNSDKTADVVMRLSKLLRFMLYESGTDRIPLAQEIKVIGDYIELEKLRYDQRLSVTFDKEITDSKVMITPLILLPFVENAFKHGASESRFETTIELNLQLQENNMLFSIKNTKDHTDIAMKEQIGLKSVRRQLELLYTKHQLEIENGPDHFKVILTIDLNSYVAL